MEFRKVLVANRGEIAVRIIRALHQMNIEAVAIYSEADRDALHVRLADQAFCVGPGPSAQSYLNIPNIISAAVLTGVDAIHPGYGYLSERADFAEICESHGIVFIGPPPAAIQQMGDKAQARESCARRVCPSCPAATGPSPPSPGPGRRQGDRLPCVVKASAGGGGRGMRAARTPDELQRLYHQARREAEAAFGSGEVYLERLSSGPGTWRSRCWPTSTGRPSTWGSGSAPCSAATRRWWRRRPRPRSARSCGPGWGRRPCGGFGPAGM